MYSDEEDKYGDEGEGETIARLIQSLSLSDHRYPLNSIIENILL
jgi:hypothetical protein